MRRSSATWAGAQKLDFLEHHAFPSRPPNRLRHGRIAACQRLRASSARRGSRGRAGGARRRGSRGAARGCIHSRAPWNSGASAAPRQIAARPRPRPSMPEMARRSRRNGATGSARKASKSSHSTRAGRQRRRGAFERGHLAGPAERGLEAVMHRGRGRRRGRGSGPAAARAGSRSAPAASASYSRRRGCSPDSGRAWRRGTGPRARLDQPVGDLAGEAGRLDIGALLRPEGAREQGGQRCRNRPSGRRELAQQQRLAQREHRRQLAEQPRDQGRADIADMEDILGVAPRLGRHGAASATA